MKRDRSPLLHVVEPDFPEGPYEGEHERASQRADDLRYHTEIQHMIRFISELRAESRRSLRLGVDLREMGIVLSLISDHFNAKLTTMSSLAQGSGMSYSTAYRAIDKMLADGLIVQRERTTTGKSFSLHPSAALLMRWEEFTRRTQQLVESDLLPIVSRRNDVAAREEPKDERRIVPPPPVLERKLSLARGLRILVHADPSFMAMTALKRQFEMILGTRLTSRALSIDRLRREIVINGERKSSAYDLVACDLPWFGEMVAAGRILPLDPLIAEAGLDLDDFLPDAIASVRHGGSIYGLPIVNTAELLVVRTDILDEAGLDPPTSTDQLLDVARALHKPQRGQCGIAWNGGRGTALGHTVMTTMASFGQAIVDLETTDDGFMAEDASGRNLRPMFDSPEAMATAEYLMALRDVSPSSILSMTWYDRADAYASGAAAMGYCHTMLANLFELDQASPACGRTGYLPPPSGDGARPVSTLGGYALVIPSNIAPERVPAVWEAMQVLTSPSAAKLFVANGSLASPRFSVSRDPEIAAMSPIIGVVDQIARDGILRMWPRPPVDGISAIIEVAGETFHEMLRDNLSPADALAAAQRQCEALMRDRGHL